MPASSSFIHLVSLTKGAMRMVLVSQVDRQSFVIKDAVGQNSGTGTGQVIEQDALKGIVADAVASAWRSPANDDRSNRAGRGSAAALSQSRPTVSSEAATDARRRPARARERRLIG